MKKLNLKWHPEAAFDLATITRYCRWRFGKTAAREVRSKILHDAELLRTHPHLGPVEPLLTECTSLEYRALVVGAHTKILYTVHTAYIYIHLLWDVRQDNTKYLQAAVRRYSLSEEEHQNKVNEPPVVYEEMN
ncbi:MAG: type II toxin-antitoxin system RelE/ParE family toxin [Bacteroides sp.]|nr:type II toxin-antitoxin system RelE/ParE family toxin [Bacteroides sp.]